MWRYLTRTLPLNIPGLNWAIVSKMDENEILAPVYKFLYLLLIGTGHSCCDDSSG